MKLGLLEILQKATKYVPAIIGMDGTEVLSTSTGGWALYDRENSFVERLIAAYNACYDIPTEVLKALPLNFSEHAAELEALKQKNKNLLAILNDIVWL